MRIRSILIIALLLVTGCAVGPDYETPVMELPAEFSNKRADGQADLSSWWENFNDPVLNKLVQEAIASNTDLKAAESRVKEARILLGASWLALSPDLELTGARTRSKASENARVGLSQGGGGPGNNNPTGGSQPVVFFQEADLYDVNLDSSWELDIFGGTRRSVESFRGIYQSRIEAWRDTLVTLLAELALNYINLRRTQYELDVTQKNIAAQRETLEIQRMRLNAGLVSDLTVAQAEAQLTNTESALPLIEAELQRFIHRIGILLNKNPVELKSELELPGKIPEGPDSVPPGLPADLLKRRPDVRQAERLLASNTADIGAALSELFPKFSLTGNIGLRSEIYGMLNEGDSKYWSYGPRVNWPILDLLANWANYKAETEQQEQAFLAYRKAVLSSLEDVENSLILYEKQKERREHLKKAADANRRSVSLAKQLDKVGAIDFLNVLTAEQALFRSEIELAQSESAVATSLIALYKALGGGWEEPAES